MEQGRSTYELFDENTLFEQAMDASISNVGIGRPSFEFSAKGFLGEGYLLKASAILFTVTHVQERNHVFLPPSPRLSLR